MKLVVILVVGILSTAQAIAQSLESYRVEIPTGGNAWVTGSTSMSKKGVSWSDPESICRIYFKVAMKGTLKLSLLLDPNEGSSTVKVRLNGKESLVRVEGHSMEFPAGEWIVDRPGYQVVEVKGVQRSGSTFGLLSGIAVRGSAVTPDMAFVKSDEGNYFYWGRRGPSVHLRYNTTGIDSIEWFYSELTVPKGNDVIGSYFMADGFKNGYFGMQVNSPTERRILFSVWSPYQTDDPNSIPEEYKIKLIRKGEKTFAGEFGNEGSGGQSYLKFDWKAGKTYRFLLRGLPAGQDQTEYTAWFFAPEAKQWTLIASFSRPKTSSHLTNLYSFLENFIPETGATERRALYHHQWVRTAGGKWHELNHVTFTGDNTARKGYRLDYAGGTDGQLFFLRNCGFFNDYVPLDRVFSIQRKIHKEPEIDWSALEKYP